MSQDAKSDFIRAVQTSSEIPAGTRNEAVNVAGLESKVLDQSYLDFLDDMILREPRGPEWTKILKRRRIALAGYCGKSLVSGIVGRGKDRIFVQADPVTCKVLYWEEWSQDDADAGGDEQR